MCGGFSGDALGLVTDCSVNTRAIDRDYGLISTFTNPLLATHADGGMHLGVNAPHIEHLGTQASVMHPATVLEPVPKSDIMFGADRFHGQRGVHPHRNLGAGDVTLNAEIGNILAKSLAKMEEFGKEVRIPEFNGIHMS